MQRTGRGELRIHMNRVDQGVAAVNVPEKVYAVVDVYGPVHTGHSGSFSKR